MVTIPFTTFINSILLEIHVHRIGNCYPLCLASKNFTSIKRMIIQINMRVQLHCQNPCKGVSLTERLDHIKLTMHFPGDCFRICTHDLLEVSCEAVLLN